MSFPKQTLVLLQERFAICKLPADAHLPDWAISGSFCSITRTPDELSVVCAQTNVPHSVKCDNDWRCLQVAGQLDFELTGVLAALTVPLAQAGISVFTLSTYNTDYLLVKQQRVHDAILALAQAGHQIRDGQRPQMGDMQERKADR